MTVRPIADWPTLHAIGLLVQRRRTGDAGIPGSGDMKGNLFGVGCVFVGIFVLTTGLYFITPALAFILLGLLVTALGVLTIQVEGG